VDAILGYRSARRLIVALSFAVILTSWLAVGLWLWRDCRDTRRDQLDGLARTSQLTAEHLRRLLSAADLGLGTLEQALDRRQPAEAAKEVVSRFTYVVGEEDCLSVIAAVDRQGRVIPLSSDTHDLFPIPPEWQSLTGTDRLMVAAPVRHGANGHWVIPLLRRIADPAHPVALLVAGLDVSALEQMYDTFRRHQSGSIALINLDGTLLVRSPPWPGALGLSLHDHPLFQRYYAGHSRQGQMLAVSPVDGISRAITFTLADPYPVATLVSMTDAEILAPWWQRVQLALAFGGLGLLVVLGGMALILYLLRRLEGEAQDLERRVEERTGELQRMVDRRRVFLASLSHELRSPLNVILGFSEALIGGLHGALTLGQRDYLTDIYRSGTLMLGLVNDLLDGAAIEAGSLRLEMGAVDLASLISEATAMIRHQAEANGASVVTRIDPPSLRLWADRRRLLQILLNLGTNAVKYAGPGSRIEMTAQLTPNQSCRIEVSDNGPGMSPEEIALALTPFGRGNDSRGIEGTGLGLPLAAGLCALHDGTLTLHSRPGQGTRVEILLPPTRVMPFLDRMARPLPTCDPPVLANG